MCAGQALLPGVVQWRAIDLWRFTEDVQSQVRLKSGVRGFRGSL